MQRYKAFAYFLVGAVFFTGIAYAAPTFIYQRSILPEADQTYYIGTTTPSNLRYNGNFYNLRVDGTCTGCTTGALLTYDAWTHPAAGQSATTSLMVFSGGFLSIASSTIGNGLQGGGLTISGGATTTGVAYFASNLGIGTTSPWGKLSVTQTGTGGAPAFIVEDAASPDQTPGFVVTQAGSVGIGTSSPARFSGAVTTALDISNTSGTIGIMAHSGDQEQSWLGNNGAGMFFDVSGAASAANNFTVFRTGRTNSSFTLTELMRLTSHGSIGIGTVSPAAQVDIVASTTARATIGTNPSLTLALPVNAGVSFPQAATFSIGTYTAHTPTAPASRLDLLLKAASTNNVIGDTTVMSWLSNGLVGIGTTTPNAKLSIAGTGQTTAALDTAGSLGDSITLGSISNTAGAGGAIVFGTANPNPQYFAAIKALATNATPNGTGDLAFSTRGSIADSTLTERMRIMANGNVGIGTTTPGTLLSLGNTGDSTINISPSATSTFGLGINLRGGCFAINGTCAGNVTGTSTATDNQIVIFDGTSGKLIQGGNGASIDDNGFLTFNNQINVNGAWTQIQATTANVDLNLKTIAGTGDIVLTTNAVDRMWINDGGNVGVASSSPWRVFSVTGTMANSGMTTATAGTNNDLCISASGDFVNESTGQCVVSSRRFKHDIRTLETSALDLVVALRPVTFSPNDPDSADYEDTHIGLIAEEVAAVDPRLVRYGTDGLPRTLDDFALISLSFKAIQELNDQLTGKTIIIAAKRTAEENWQNILIGLLILGFLYQQWQIRKLKRA